MVLYTEYHRVFAADKGAFANDFHRLLETDNVTMNVPNEAVRHVCKCGSFHLEVDL